MIPKNKKSGSEKSANVSTTQSPRKSKENDKKRGQEGPRESEQRKEKITNRDERITNNNEAVTNEEDEDIAKPRIKKEVTRQDKERTRRHINTSRPNEDAADLPKPERKKN